MQIRASKIRYQGSRDEQQDVVQLRQLPSRDRADNYLVAVLTDGIGGLASGREASEVVNAAVIDDMSRSLPGIATSDSEQIHDALKQAAETANTGLREFQTKNGLEPCGATLIICVLTRRQLHFLSIGDSLLLSSSGGLVLQKLNTTHEQLSGERSYLTSAILGSEIKSVDQASLDLAASGITAVLLGSDGLAGQDLLQIARILNASDNGKLNAIVELVHAKADPAQDNLAMILLELA